MSKIHRIVVWYILTTFLVSPKSYSQVNPDSSNITLLNEVVVSGSKQVFDSLDTIETKTNILDMLDQVPGMFKIHESYYPIIYRGMHADRLRIERDGAAKTGVTNQGYYANDINPDDISEIRMVHGADQVLFGSGAGGGVVQIASREPYLHQTHQVYYVYGTNGNAHTLGGRFGLRSYNKGVVLGARHQQTDHIAYANQQEALNSASAQNNISLGAYYFSEKHLKMQWNHFLSNGEWERPQGFQNNPHELRTFKNRYDYQSNLEIEWGKGSSNEANLWFSAISTSQLRDNYNIDFSEVTFSETRSYDQMSLGYRYIRSDRIGEKFTGKTGTDFTLIRQHEERTSRNSVTGQLEADPRQLVRLETRTGLFLQVGQSLGRELTAVYSLRGDLGSLGESIEQWRTMVTGSASIQWKPARLFNSYWTLGRYFRWPTSQESTGEFAGGRGIFLGNEDIEPETSYQLDWVLDGHNDWFGYQINTWFGYMIERITEVPVSEGTFTYENVDQARTMGMEADLSFMIFRLPGKTSVQLTQQAQLIRGDIISEGILDEGMPLFGIPPNRIGWGLNIRQKLSNKLDLTGWLQHQFVFPFDRLPDETIRQIWAVRPAPEYHLIHVKVEINYRRKDGSIDFGADISNLMDTFYIPFGTNIPGIGRNVQLFLRVSL